MIDAIGALLFTFVLLVLMAAFDPCVAEGLVRINDATGRATTWLVRRIRGREPRPPS